MTINADQWTDLDPTQPEHEGTAAFRGDHAADQSPVLTLLARDIRRNLATSLAREVFVRTSPALAEVDINCWLAVSPMSVFTRDVRESFARTYAQAWFPRSLHA